MNMTTAITQQAAPLAIQFGITDMQLETLRQTYAKGATDAQLVLYAHDCQRNGVSPLDRLIHFTQRDGKYTPITSIDFLRSRASDTGELAGIKEAEYEGEPKKDGFIARVTVFRFVQGVRCEFTASARWGEYYPGEKPGFMWQKMPYVMLGKCAEAQALRKAFPKQLAGLYIKDEMQQADMPTVPQKVEYTAYEEAPKMILTDHPSMELYKPLERQSDPKTAWIEENAPKVLGENWRHEALETFGIDTESAMTDGEKSALTGYLLRKQEGKFLSDADEAAFIQQVNTFLAKPKF